jgi:hypothetical protein
MIVINFTRIPTLGLRDQNRNENNQAPYNLNRQKSLIQNKPARGHSKDRFKLKVNWRSVI